MRRAATRRQRGHRRSRPKGASLMATDAIANELTVLDEPVVIDQFIADVLQRAHRTARAVHAHDEARAILGVAQLFAEDLARTDPDFDRPRFGAAVMEDAS